MACGKHRKTISRASNKGMPKETLIKELDDKESRRNRKVTFKENLIEPSNIIKSKEDSSSLTSSIKNSISNFKDNLFSEDNLVLLILLLVAFHPTVNSTITNTLQLGGSTFVAKAIIIVAIYFIYREFL